MARSFDAAAQASTHRKARHIRGSARMGAMPPTARKAARRGRPRSHVSDGAKHRDLDPEKLALTDAHVKMAPRLKAAFGLRREEVARLE